MYRHYRKELAAGVQACTLLDIAARYDALTATPTSAPEAVSRTQITRGGIGAVAWRGGLSGIGVRGSRVMERVVGGILWGMVLGTTPNWVSGGGGNTAAFPSPINYYLFDFVCTVDVW